MSARVLGLDYLKESSVGDFLLGSRSPDDSVAGDPEAGWAMLNSPEWSLPVNSPVINVSEGAQRLATE
ncbi:hypothetical protein [Streptomyces sp. NBC_00009]